MFNSSSFKPRRWSLPAQVLGAGLLALLAGCSGSSSSSPSGGGTTPPTPYAELLFVSDQDAIRTINASGTTRTELGIATLPGIPGTYARAGSLVTVVMPKHGIRDGLWVEFDFSGGAGGTATDGKYKVTKVNDDSFTVTDSASGTITGGTVIRKTAFTFTGTYAQAGTVITVTVPNHGLIAQDQVTFQFTSGTAVNTTQKVVSATAGTFTVTMPTTATTSGNVTVTFGNNYSIFDLAMHPSGKWLYVASLYDCTWGTPYCWGGELISRYGINWTTGALTLEESVRAIASDVYNAPVALVFSSDGTRLFNQDDNLDGLRMWSVNTTTGALTYVAETAENVTRAHGLVASPDGTRIYHADNVFSATGTSLSLATATPANHWDNSNFIINNTLFGAGIDWNLRAYSLASPAAPALLATASTSTTNQARSIALSANGSRIVASGWGGLKAFTYDGAAAITAVAAAAGELRDGGAPWPANNTTRRMYRSVSMNRDGNLLASAYFTNIPNIPSGARTSGVPSGYVLASLAADGSMALVSDTSNLTYARVAKFFQKP